MATTYAQRADVEGYIEGWVTDDTAALDRLIQRAERDIDSVVGPYGVTYTVGDLTLPSATILLNDTGDLSATGTVTIGGQSVTYTGKTLTSLTGAMGGTGDIKPGTAVYRYAASGLKFDPITQLTAAQQVALKRATCAQVEYRFEMGERFFVQAQYQQVSGPDFSQTGRLPRIGEKVYRELEGFGLLRETPVG